jgi:NET1-associated nuclear protein 1 (U3 small nucleolar RNA-associated protein 17)
MILSTSELQPIFNVAGIQIPALRKTGILLPFIPTVDAPSQEFLLKGNLIYPAVLNPVISGRLLVAVPSSTASRLAIGARNAACYLQTFDLGSAQQISKQSLTRTKTTTLNIGPESNTIEEPNVLYMKISYDGQWLATVDEWLPPRRDISLLAFDKEREVEEQSRRRETYLKFWQWNDIVNTWELFSRIDDPHSSSSSTNYDANMILELESDPSRVGFATIGNESIVKFWKPSIRQRHGKEVRDKNGRAMSNWSCPYTGSLGSVAAISATTQQRAQLAYSRDGSVVAAAYCLSSPSTHPSH